MGTNIIVVWDIETVPDLRGFALAIALDGKSDEDVRTELGDKFPKLIYHSIVCIGALVAHRDSDRWVVDAVGAPHCGERSEKELIASFVGRIADLAPQLVTFNGNSFDLPVLRSNAQHRPTHSRPLQSCSTGGRHSRANDASPSRRAGA